MQIEAYSDQALSRLTGELDAAALRDAQPEIQRGATTALRTFPRRADAVRAGRHVLDCSGCRLMCCPAKSPQSRPNGAAVDRADRWQRCFSRCDGF